MKKVFFVEKGEERIVGVNVYQADEKLELERIQIDPEIEAMAHHKLATLRRERDNAKVNALLARLAQSAAGNENLMPLLIHLIAYTIRQIVC